MAKKKGLQGLWDSANNAVGGVESSAGNAIVKGFSDLFNAIPGTQEGKNIQKMGNPLASLFGGGGGGSAPSTATTVNQDAATTLASPLSQLLSQNSDPLGMQLLWTKTIQPYMQQLAAQGQSDVKQYDQTIQQGLKNQMPEYARQIFQASAPQMEAALTNQNNAMQGMVTAAPQWNQLISTLTNTQSSDRLLQAELAKALIGGAGTGLLDQLLGQAPTTAPGTTPSPTNVPGLTGQNQATANALLGT